VEYLLVERGWEREPTRA